MATKKTNGKRKSPSAERLLALALVRVCECVLAVDLLEQEVSKADAMEDKTKKMELRDQALTDRKLSINEARKALADNGYADLESIATRVAAINDQIQAALSLGDGKALALLGPALERAKKGLPPIAKAEKKAKTTTERKVKVSKAVKSILDAFDTTTFAFEGRIVTSIKAGESGKSVLCQFDDEQWVNVDPKALKPVEDPAKGSGTPTIATAKEAHEHKRESGEGAN